MYRVELTGGPRHRGQAYGETLRQQIQAAIDRFWYGITKGSGQDPKIFLRMWLSEMNFLPAIERWTPVLLEEVKGIGEGAALDFDTILSWQFLDELGWYINHFYLPRLLDKTHAKAEQDMQCSSVGIAARAGRPTILAQNWDSNILLDGAQTLLHIKYPENEKEIFAVAAAGRIGPFGFSSHGIGVCMNSLNEFVNYSSDGLPVVFVGRGILEQVDYQRACSFILNVKHATGQAYAVGGKEEISIFECSANQVCRYLPETGSSQFVHTNHPIVNTDLRIPPDALKKQSSSFLEIRKERENNTFTRFNCIQKRLEEAGDSADIETVKAILRSHDSAEYPVCLHPGPVEKGATMFGMIMEFSTPAVFHISSGRPCEHKFESLHFQRADLSK